MEHNECSCNFLIEPPILEITPQILHTERPLDTNHSHHCAEEHSVSLLFLCFSRFADWFCKLVFTQVIRVCRKGKQKNLILLEMLMWQIHSVIKYKHLFSASIPMKRGHNFHTFCRISLDETFRSIKEQRDTPAVRIQQKNVFWQIWWWYVGFAAIKCFITRNLFLFGHYSCVETTKSTRSWWNKNVHCQTWDAHVSPACCQHRINLKRVGVGRFSVAEATSWMVFQHALFVRRACYRWEVVGCIIFWLPFFCGSVFSITFFKFRCVAGNFRLLVVIDILEKKMKMFWTNLSHSIHRCAGCAHHATFGLTSSYM